MGLSSFGTIHISPKLNLKTFFQMKRNLMALCTLLAASAMLLASCQDAEEQTVNEPVDMTTRATSFDNFARVVYVEVNDVNPLNAGEYLLPGGVPFFTHVILFASNIRGDTNGNVNNFNNPNCAAILANPAKYIAPLQAKGIKVLMGNLGDHTGAGFSNLTAAQIESYTNDLIAYDNIVDGYDFDDEWADYGTHGYPEANTTSFSNLILALNGKTNKMITVFDFGYAKNLSAAAAACVDLASFSTLNGYSTSPSFSIPLARYCSFFCDLTTPPSDAVVKLRVNNSKNANAGGVCFFNLPMSPNSVLSKFNAAAQAFSLSVSHSGTTYTKDYGNN